MTDGDGNPMTVDEYMTQLGIAGMVLLCDACKIDPDVPRVRPAR